MKGRGRRNPRERPRPISGRTFDRMTKLFFTSKRERGRDVCVSVIVNASAGVIMTVSAIVSVIVIIVVFLSSRIMMLTVMKNTKNPVKFWFLKNFLSPTMTVMINDFTSDPVNIA